MSLQEEILKIIKQKLSYEEEMAWRGFIGLWFSVNHTATFYFHLILCCTLNGSRSP